MFSHHSTRIERLIKVFAYYYIKKTRAIDEPRFYRYIFIYLYQKTSNQEKTCKYNFFKFSGALSLHVSAQTCPNRVVNKKDNCAL